MIIKCPYCSFESYYIIDSEAETLCCLQCFRYINVNCSDENVIVINTRKNYAKYGFGNSRVYKFLLLYFYKKYPELVKINDLITKIVSVDKSLENPVIDVSSKMIGSEIELIDNNSNYAKLSDKQKTILDVKFKKLCG